MRVIQKTGSFSHKRPLHLNIDVMLFSQRRMLIGLCKLFCWQLNGDLHIRPDHLCVLISVARLFLFCSFKLFLKPFSLKVFTRSLVDFCSVIKFVLRNIWFLFMGHKACHTRRVFAWGVTPRGEREVEIWTWKCCIRNLVFPVMLVLDRT